MDSEVQNHTANHWQSWGQSPDALVLKFPLCFTRINVKCLYKPMGPVREALGFHLETPYLEAGADGARGASMKNKRSGPGEGQTY